MINDHAPIQSDPNFYCRCTKKEETSPALATPPTNSPNCSKYLRNRFYDGWNISTYQNDWYILDKYRNIG